MSMEGRTANMLRMQQVKKKKTFAAATTAAAPGIN